MSPTKKKATKKATRVKAERVIVEDDKACSVCGKPATVTTKTALYCLPCFEETTKR